MSNENKTKAEFVEELKQFTEKLTQLEIKGVERSNNDERIKKSEERLAQPDALYRELADNISDYVIALDFSGNIIFFNKAALEVSGYTAEEARKLNAFDLAPAEYIQEMTQRLTQRRQGEKSHSSFEMEFITKEGARIFVDVSSNVITDHGEPRGLLLFGRNVAVRKKIEDELRESQRRFQNIANNVPGIIYQFVIHKDGSASIPFISESAKNLGINTAEFVNNPAKLFNFINKDERKKVWEGILESMNSLSRRTWESEVNINGDKRWLRFISQPRLLENGDVLWDGLILDMSEIKKTEQEKQDLEERFRQAQKMEAIGTLAGGIAHDINNLLMGIQGYTSLMLLDSDSRHPYYRKLKSIEELVESGANLTKQLLGFARRGRYEVKPTNLNDIIEKTASLFGRTKKEIFINQLFQKDLWTVEVDQGQIEQVLLNLYVNAWQAMPAGGNLYLETKNIRVSEEETNRYSLPEGRYVKICVTDTGIGIDEATRLRIFEPFFTTKEMGRGTGLGLATVYGIIKGHGGVINVYSEKGHGTTFRIYLPVSDKEIVKEKKSQAVIVKGHETILLVDDEDAVITVTQELLKVLGYKVIIAKSGVDAVKIFRKNHKKIDVVILDMIMPEMSGGETFDYLKAIDPEVTVILSSGYSINGQASDIMKRGCKSFIQKPFTIVDISAKIREALEES
jgi:two-component system cell cycle sensor histidine kinase/response regulator CckA